MDMIEAVRNRILTLCGEHEITINKLADLAGLPPSSVKNILYGKAAIRSWLPSKCCATAWT